MFLSAPRLLRAAVALGVTAVAASMVYLAPSQAATDLCSGFTDSVRVEVTVTGDVQASQGFSGRRVCELADIHADYYVRDAKGHVSQLDLPNYGVTSLRTLAGNVQVGGGQTLPLGLIKFVQVVDDNGNSHAVSGATIRDPASVYPSPLQPALWYEPDFMSYARPQASPTDVNIGDHLQFGPSEPVTVIVHTRGSLLTPSISVDTSRVDFGGTVGFRANLTDTPPPGVTYHWDFGDGAHLDGGPAVAQAPSHTYDKGTCTFCQVRLTVTGDDTSFGSTAVSIQVGASPSPSTTGPTSPATTGPTSPATSGPTSPATTGPVSTATGTASGNPSGQASSGPTSDASQVAGPHGSPTDGPTDGASVGPTSAPSRSSGPGGSGGRVVAGQLLLASQVYAVPKDAAAAAAASGGQPSPTHLSRSWKWLGVLVFPLLICLGMAGESVQMRRRLAKMTPVNSASRRWRRGEHA